MVPDPAVAAPGAAVPSVAVTVTVVAAATGASVVMETTPVAALIVTHPLGKAKVVASNV